MRRVTRKWRLSHQVQEGLSQPGCHRCCPRPGHDPRCPAPLIRDRPRNVQPLVLPPAARPLPLGRRGHRFPRSHGPPERKIKATWLTLRCPANPSRSSAQTAPARPARGARGRDAEGTREPQESARNRRTCRRAKRRRIGAGPAPRQSMLTDTPKEPESRRNPGEFADHDAEEDSFAGAGDGRSFASPERCAASTRAKKPKEPCLVGMWHGGGAPAPCTGRGAEIGRNPGT